MNLSLYVWIILNVLEAGICFYLLTDIMYDMKSAGNAEKIFRVILFVIMAVLIGGRYRIGSLFSVRAYVYSVLVLTAGMCLAYRRRLIRIAGAVMAYCSFVTLLTYLLVFFLSILYAYQVPTENGMNSFINVNEQFCLIRMAALLMMLFVVWRIRKSGLTGQMAEHPGALLISGAVMTLLVVEYGQLLEYGFMYSSSDIPVIRTVLRDSMLSMLTSAVLLTMFGALYLKNRMIRNENDFLIMKEELESRKYEELSAALEQNRELIHDTKNHYLVISEYERNGEYDSLHRYVEDLRKNFVKVTPEIYTGNRILDLILSQKRMTAQKNGIDFNVNVMPLAHLPFAEREICSLFGNLLDNAVEACGRAPERKEICVNIRRQNQMLFVEIRNTVKEKPIRKGRHFMTWKQDQDMHGYGLRSVERIVKEYDGLITCEPEGDEFVVTVTFFNME